MSELDDQILGEIEIFEDTSFKALEYIKTHDWTVLKDRADRVAQHDFQKELTQSNLNLASKFYELAKSELSHPDVKAVIDKFKQFLDIYMERFTRYKEENDWTTYSETGAPGKRPEDLKSELSFQSTIVNNLQGFKKLWKKVDAEGQVGSLSIGVHHDIPLPMMFEGMAMERHPEIGEFIDRRREREKK